MPPDSAKKTRYESISLNLRKPRSPRELDERLIEIDKECGIDFWIHGGLKVAREAAAACHFGYFLGASTVWMADKIWPDFWLKVGNEDIPFELVGVHNPEAIIPKWLATSAKEHANGEKPAPLKVDLRIVERDLDAWINSEVEKKAAKAAQGNYQPGTVLAVYGEFYVPKYIFDAILRSLSTKVGDKAPYFRAIVMKFGLESVISHSLAMPYKRLNPANSDAVDSVVTKHYRKYVQPPS